MATVRKAVITAAGRGTRQYPASSAVQKEMFPLVDRDGVTKPVIQIISEEALGSGIEEICIVTPPGGEQSYRDYFRRPDTDALAAMKGKDWAQLESQRLAEFGRRMRFAEQATPEGFGHAVYQARAFVGDAPFLLLLGDHVYISETKDRCARQLINVFEEHHNLIALSGVQLAVERELHLVGVIRGAVVDAQRGIYRAERIAEKPSIEEARATLTSAGVPAGNYLAHFGMHVFSAGIFDALEHLIAHDLRQNGEIQLTAAQDLLRERSADAYWAAVCRGQRYDTGIPYGLMEAQLALGLNGVHRTEMCAAIARILAMQGKE